MLKGKAILKLCLWIPCFLLLASLLSCFLEYLASLELVLCLSSWEGSRCKSLFFLLFGQRKEGIEGMSLFGWNKYTEKHWKTYHICSFASFDLHRVEGLWIFLFYAILRRTIMACRCRHRWKTRANMPFIPRTNSHPPNIFSPRGLTKNPGSSPLAWNLSRSWIAVNGKWKTKELLMGKERQKTILFKYMHMYT